MSKITGNIKQRYVDRSKYQLQLKLLQKWKDLFDGTLHIWRKDPVYFKLKDEYTEVIGRFL